MNLVEHKVTKVITSPYRKYYCGSVVWNVVVEYNCYGQKGITTLSFNSEEEAKSVKVGYCFNA